MQWGVGLRGAALLNPAGLSEASTKEPHLESGVEVSKIGIRQTGEDWHGQFTLAAETP